MSFTETDHLTGEILFTSSPNTSSTSVTLVTQSSGHHHGNHYGNHHNHEHAEKLNIDHIVPNASSTIEIDCLPSEVTRNPSLLGTTTSLFERSDLSGGTQAEDDSQARDSEVPYAVDPSRTLAEGDLHYLIDPSQTVFGSAAEELQYVKEERQVRRIDSLFCTSTTTPSSIDSMEPLFEAQAEHNITATEISLESDDIDDGDDDSLEMFSDSNNALSMASESDITADSLDLTGSFNSTTLPTISPEQSAISSGDDYNIGQLKYF